MDWHLGNLVGKGFQANIWASKRYKSEDDTVYAVKLSSSHQKSNRYNLRREIQILSQLDSPYIVHYTEGYDADGILPLLGKAEGGNYTLLVMEMIRGRDLEEQIKLEGGLDRDNIKKFIKDIGKGLLYLKGKNVYHCDIKPPNIMYCFDKQVFKLIDFGYAMKEGENHLVSCGTPYYMAPEIVKSKSTEIIPYSCDSDMWSFGVTIYYAHYTAVPWKSMELHQLIKEIINGIPESSLAFIPEGLKDILKKTMTAEREKRIKIEELLSHPFLSDENSKENN